MTVRIDQDMVVAALRGAPPAGADGWTPRLLSAATAVPFMRVRSAIRALRMAGKIEFSTLTLSLSMLAAGGCSLAPAAGASIGGDGDGAGVRAAEVARTPDVSLLVRPTGAQLTAEIDAFCRSEGISRNAFVTVRMGKSPGLMTSIQNARYPSAKIVEAVAAISGVAQRQGLVTPHSVTPHPLRSASRVCASPRSPIKKADIDNLDERRLDGDRRLHLHAVEIQRVAAAEAAARGAARSNARSTGSVVGGARLAVVDHGLLEGLSLGDRASALMIETPIDALQVTQRVWPDLWARLIAMARAQRMRPGTLMFRAIALGLDAVDDGAII
jgi:hypothetical protein